MFEVGEYDVIRGWSQGVQLMKRGATYKFEIPPRLAYGRMGSKRHGIGRSQTLIYRIELLEILDRE